jgi:hypothetical protein
LPPMIRQTHRVTTDGTSKLAGSNRSAAGCWSRCSLAHRQDELPRVTIPVLTIVAGSLDHAVRQTASPAEMQSGVKHCRQSIKEPERAETSSGERLVRGGSAPLKKRK